MSDLPRMFEPSTETATPAYRIPSQPTDEPSPASAAPTPPPAAGTPSPPPAGAPAATPRRQQRLSWILGGAGLAFIAVVVVAALAGNKPAKQAAPPAEIRIGQNCTELGRSAVTIAGTPVRCTNGTWQATAPVEPPAAAVPEPPPAADAPPKAADFRLTVKILRKQCFGSAGCNLSFRIDVAYDGPTFTGSYLVTYEVRGGEDGPLVNSFTIEGDTAQVESEETIGTKSSRSKLTARVTDVTEN
jgi:hypothetical protein